MPAPVIPDLPQYPSPNDPDKARFNREAYEFTVALQPFVDAVNAFGSYIGTDIDVTKTLRTPEDIAALPSAAGRANRILWFNEFGEPAPISSGGARSLLNVEDGAQANPTDIEILTSATNASGIDVEQKLKARDFILNGISVNPSAIRAELNVENGATANDTNANLRNRATHTGAQAISTVTGLQSALDAKLDDSQLKTNLLSPDNSSVPSTLAVALTIASFSSGITPKGNWNASTNTPTLVSSVGTEGDSYDVVFPGTTNLNGETGWQEGDTARFASGVWHRVPGIGVKSLDGRTGAVILNYDTVADAAAASLPVGAKYSTKGADAVGDGGHGDFIASATPPAILNGYSGYVLANGNYGVLQKPWNALQFGARADNTTNDAPLIQPALNAYQGFLQLPKTNSVSRYKFDTSLSLGGLDGIGGNKALETNITLASPINMAASFSEVRNVRLDQENDAEYAIHINGTDPDFFGNHINNIKVTGLKGIDNAGLETKINFVYGVGEGAAVANGVGLNISQFDTSLSFCILERYRRGVITNRGLQSVDLHLVKCERALNASSNGLPFQTLNTYLDTPSEIGMQLQGMTGAQVVNTQVLKVGQDGIDPLTCFGFTLDATSSGNSFVNVVFAQPDDAVWAGGFSFASSAINNLFVGVSGAYKLNATNVDRIRNQTFIGGMNGWARHNNVPRNCRARAPGVPAGATVDLVFILDWNYPAASNNFFLFTGKWASRGTTNDAAHGTADIVVSNASIGISSLLAKQSGAAAVSWAVNAVVLSGSTLTVTIENTGSVAGSISMELRRSIDPSGISF